jgi:peptidoglycan/xylan/chitin deacetylase (PgdA/CDA1 family)
MSGRRVLITLFYTVVALVFCLVVFLRLHYVVPIIMYHSISPLAKSQNRLAVSVKNFERQMYFLKRARYNILPLESLADLIREKGKLPPRTVIITFDDGYKDNYVYAFPILQKYKLPATIFIISNEVNRPDRLSWEEIKEMQASGLITFGSHTLGPKPLIDIQSEEELRKQVFVSKKVLEEKLNRSVDLFSYPGGMFTQNIRRLVIEAGYKAAVATSPGKKFPNNDIFALKRLRISSTSNNLFVFWFEISGCYTFIKEHRDED